MYIVHTSSCVAQVTQYQNNIIYYVLLFITIFCSSCEDRNGAEGESTVIQFYVRARVRLRAFFIVIYIIIMYAAPVKIRDRIFVKIC